MLNKTRLIIVVTMIVTCYNAMAVESDEMGTGVINVRGFTGHVINLGQANEDWHEAFELAIGQARATSKSVYVPAGEYKIRQAIEVGSYPGDPCSPVLGGAVTPVRILGDGKYRSVIHQTVPSENLINWTGTSTSERLANGILSKIGLWGGNIALNIQWHDNFTFDRCCIKGAQIGVYTQGNHSRLQTSCVQDCNDYGVFYDVGSEHMTIRDSLFRHNGLGVRFHTVMGAEINGSTFEQCANSAIYAHGATGLAIQNSHFDGNGYDSAEFSQGLGYPASVQLDYNCNNISIKNNVFKGTGQANGNLLTVSYCNVGVVAENIFEQSDRAIMLKDQCETNPGFGHSVSRLLVKNNSYDNIMSYWLTEEVAGLLADANSLNSEFYKSLGSPRE